MRQNDPDTSLHLDPSYKKSVKFHYLGREITPQEFSKTVESFFFFFLLPNNGSILNPKSLPSSQMHLLAPIRAPTDIVPDIWISLTAKAMSQFSESLQILRDFPPEASNKSLRTNEYV